MPPETQATRLIEYARAHGMVRPRDLQNIDVKRQTLKRLVDSGKLVARTRGVYTLPDHDLTRHTQLAEVCARSPSVTVCLISALEYHELTTQIPRGIWIMIPRKGRRPKIEYPPLRIVYASGKALTTGVDNYKIEGVQVPMTSPAKTVADCFKYRDRVGQDVAIEALRDCIRQRKATPAEIYEMAKIDRITKLISPYIEVLI